MMQEPSEEDKVALAGEGDSQKPQPEQSQQKKPIQEPTQNPQAEQSQAEQPQAKKNLTRYYDENEKQVRIKDFPELIGKGPSGCLALLVLVMLIFSLDPIFVGYGIIIGLIKLAEWIGNVFL